MTLCIITVLYPRNKLLVTQRTLPPSPITVIGGDKLLKQKGERTQATTKPVCVPFLCPTLKSWNAKHNIIIYAVGGYFKANLKEPWKPPQPFFVLTLPLPCHAYVIKFVIKFNFWLFQSAPSPCKMWLFKISCNVTIGNISAHFHISANCL
jgi:hypothetical protein